MRDNVTLVLPTHNRPRLLARALHFYANSQLPLLIIDSSPEPSDLAGLKRPGVSYRHCPGTSYEGKLIRPLNEITTPLVAFTADDSFTLPSAVAACAEHLLARPATAAAYGRYASVAQRGQELLVDSCYDANPSGVHGNRAAERLREIFQPYVPPFYGVVRTEVWRDTLAAPFGQMSFYGVLELTQAALTAIHGQIAVLPLLYSVLEDVPSLAQASAHGLERLDSEPGLRGQYAAFLGHLAGVLARREGLGQDEALAVVEQGMEVFIREYCPPKGRKTVAGRVARELRQGLRLLSGAKTSQKAGEEMRKRARGEALLASLSVENRREFDSIAALVKNIALFSPHPEHRTGS